MIQIGFCDDDPSVLDELHELLGSYRAEHNADIAPTAFQSPFELLASIEKGARFEWSMPMKRYVRLVYAVPIPI